MQSRGLDWSTIRVICEECCRPSTFLWAHVIAGDQTLVAFSCCRGPIVTFPPHVISFDDARRSILLSMLDVVEPEELRRMLEREVVDLARRAPMVASLMSIVSGRELQPRDGMLVTAARVADDSEQALEAAAVRLAELYRDGMR